MRGSKKTRIKPRFFIFLACLIIIAFGVFIAYKQLSLNISEKKIVIEQDKNYILFNEDKTYLIYPSKMVVEIPNDIRISGKKTLEELKANDDFQEIILKLNLVLPEKIDKYILNVDIEYEGEIKDFPYLEENVLKLIDAHGLTQLFMEEYYGGEPSVKKTKVVVDIINCTGDSKNISKDISGIVNKFRYKTNLSEDTANSTTYVINNGLSKEAFRELALFIKRKYIVEKTNKDINTVAKAIIMLGNDKQNNIRIMVSTEKNNKKSTTAKTLEKNGYGNISKEIIEHSEKNSTIYYSHDYYFMAYKISRLLRINKMEEKETDYDIKIIDL